MPAAHRPAADRDPPRGVPRWLWPPPGAQVRAVLIAECVDAAGRARYEVRAGPAPETPQLRAVRWLLDEHGRAALPRPGCRVEGEVRLEIARTAMAGGRIGHTYALNGGPLGAPAADGSRGVLWRYLEAVLGA